MEESSGSWLNFLFYLIIMVGYFILTAGGKKRRRAEPLFEVEQEDPKTHPEFPIPDRVLKKKSFTPQLEAKTRKKRRRRRGPLQKMVISSEILNPPHIKR